MAAPLLWLGKPIGRKGKTRWLALGLGDEIASRSRAKCSVLCVKKRNTPWECIWVVGAVVGHGDYLDWSWCQDTLGGRLNGGGRMMRGGSS